MLWMKPDGYLKSGKPATTSARFWAGWNTISSPDTGEAYMTRIWVGRLRLHIFWTEDPNRDPHDHPWGFWTLPLGWSYVEDVFRPIRQAYRFKGSPPPPKYYSTKEIVHAWRWSYRGPEHAHRVLGRWSGEHKARWQGRVPVPEVKSGPVVTLVWRERFTERRWGYFKLRDGRWCWQHWKDYLLNGGADAPCD